MNTIVTLYNELKNVRVYLIKIGPSRRSGKVLGIKLNEANDIYQKYEIFLLEFKEKVKNKYFSNEDILLIDNYCLKFVKLYEDIFTLCQSESTELDVTMSSFDLKTALSLLHIMTNEDSNTKQLIDNILYYDSILTADTCKRNLINFVLKSRLSQEAKLKLNSNYTSVNDLIGDMRKILLCKKGATAIQEKLSKMRQNDLSIGDYGREITELFVNLTISQADGNDKAYSVLKPLNEKTAIKQFIKGLRNRRLNTILTARNYNNLKEAIQDAQDEDESSASTGEIMGMGMYRKPYKNNYYRNNHDNSRAYRGGRSSYPSSRGRARGQGHWTPPAATAVPRGQYFRGRFSGYRQPQRGTFVRSHRGNYRSRGERYINSFNEEKTEAEVTPNQFFRD